MQCDIIKIGSLIRNKVPHSREFIQFHAWRFLVWFPYAIDVILIHFFICWLIFNIIAIIDCKSFVMVMILICNWNVWKELTLRPHYLCVLVDFSFIKPHWLMLMFDHWLLTYLVFISLQVLKLKWIQLLCPYFFFILHSNWLLFQNRVTIWDLMIYSCLMKS